MVEIARDRREILTGLFEEWEETLLWSCLQGCMGRAWADDEHHPRAAQVVVGDFLFWEVTAPSRKRPYWQPTFPAILQLRKLW